MRINNNLMAMNTHRQLGISNNEGAKSMEKLSSGFRINRAGDDAAGLAISEKMRGQIRGLNQASRNAQDGISLIQTAEGALDETHAILQRMRELAVQSSTDTNTPQDREEIQKEVDQLAAEITRISETTQFNTMNLLDGTYEGKKFHIGANEGQNTTIAISDMSAEALKVAAAGKFSAKIDGITYDSTNADIKEIKIVATVETGAGTDINATAMTKEDISLEEGVLTVNIALPKGTGDEIAVADLNALLKEYGVTASGVTTSAGTNSAEFAVKTQTIGGITDAVVKVKNDDVKGLTFADNSGATGKEFEVADDGAGNLTVTAGQTLTLDELNDKLASYGITVSTEAAGVTGETAVGAVGADVVVDMDAQTKAINVSTQTSADKAITTINTAISTVSSERSKLGAMQNRLEHTIKNLDTSAENLQASEARIRDVDMAQEMMEQTKQSILQQAATAMLAQANQAPQTVLQLLR